MFSPINCNYVRVAIFESTSKYFTKQNKLPKGALSDTLRDYNSYFKEAPHLAVTYSTVNKKFLEITRRFSHRWNHKEDKKKFLKTFSVAEWKKLESSEKSKHSLRACQACENQHQNMSQTFPGAKRWVTKPPQILFTKKDLSTPKQFGSKLLNEANSIATTHFGKPIQEVLVETPKSKLAKRKSSRQRLSEKREILRDIKSSIQNQMEKDGDSVVLQNRLSWNTFDKIRKQQGLQASCGPGQKRPLTDPTQSTPKRRRHGTTPSMLQVDKEQLIEEARTWDPDMEINWSKLGTSYGLTAANRGQTTKEFLKEQGIPVACTPQRPLRAPRRQKKRLPGGQISVPMYKPLSVQKEKVVSKIQSGDINIGREIVHTIYYLLY